jgi:hypothetical protein
LGNGTTSNTNRPANVASNVVAVAAGCRHSLFVKDDGTLWAMGGNTYGQLGNGTSSHTNRPVNVASNVVAVAAGYHHSLFVKNDGTLWAMGYNAYGQLGNGTTSNTNRPVQISGVSLANVALGNAAFHSLAVGLPDSPPGGRSAVALRLPPKLQILRRGGNVQLAWPTAAGTFQLQSAGNPNGEWSDVTARVLTTGTNATLTLPPIKEQRYYRLLGR